MAVLACLPALAVHGQPKQVSGPVAGYVFDGVALRPIDGVPGGATLGDALDLGLAASAVTVSPQFDSAIVMAADGSLHLFTLGGHSATEVAWDGVPRWPERVVYSPSGTAAAIYVFGQIQVVGGLPRSPAPGLGGGPGSPRAGHSRQPSSAAPPAGAAPQAMAVSDDGAWLLLASDGRVSLQGGNGSSRVLLDGVREAGVAFAPGGHFAVVLNGAGPWLEVFAETSSAVPAEELPAPGLAAPVGLAFSADGKLVLAASRASKSITIFDLGGGTSSTLDCNCAPTLVARLGSLFRLTEAGSGPVWMVDTGASPPRIVFVPARGNQ